MEGRRQGVCVLSVILEKLPKGSLEEQLYGSLAVMKQRTEIGGELRGIRNERLI